MEHLANPTLAQPHNLIALISSAFERKPPTGPGNSCASSCRHALKNVPPCSASSSGGPVHRRLLPPLQGSAAPPPGPRCSPSLAGEELTVPVQALARSFAVTAGIIRG